MNPEIKIENGSGEYIIRQGVAAKPIEPITFKIDGNIDSPLRWLQKRGAHLDLKECHILVDKNVGSICLVINEKSPLGDEIIGRLVLHPDFVKFGLNTGEQHSTFELSDMIKAYRSHFADKTAAMKLVTDLRKFTAKVDKDLEAFKDDRANYKMKKIQTVETNIPQSFFIEVPIFKGQEKVKIEVEISIDPDRLTCSLVSPEANDYILAMKEDKINEIIDQVKEIEPTLVIIDI